MAHPVPAIADCFGLISYPESASDIPPHLEGLSISWTRALKSAARIVKCARTLTCHNHAPPGVRSALDSGSSCARGKKLKPDSNVEEMSSRMSNSRPSQQISKAAKMRGQAQIPDDRCSNLQRPKVPARTAPQSSGLLRCGRSATSVPACQCPHAMTWLAVIPDFLLTALTPRQTELRRWIYQRCVFRRSRT